MKIKILPNVLYCSVTACAYNDHEKCRAGSITIDGPEPLCDTFFTSQFKGGQIDGKASVGACKNATCLHNQSYECTAHGIEVSLHFQKPECDTFVVRRDVQERRDI